MSNPPKINVRSMMPGDDGADAVFRTVGLLTLLVWQNGGQMRIEGLNSQLALSLLGEYDDDGDGVTLQVEVFNPQSEGG